MASTEPVSIQTFADARDRYLALLQAGDVAGAQQLIASTLERWPEDPGTLTLAVADARSRGDFAAAIDLSRRAEAAAASPEQRGEAVCERGLTLLVQNRPDAAEAELAAIDPALRDTIGFHWCEIVILQVRWRLKDAYDRTRALHEAHPEHPGVTLMWGWAQSHQGEYDAALATFAGVPGPLSGAQQAETLSFTGRWPEALRGLETLARDFPFEPTVLRMYATLLLRRHRYDEALGLADRTLAIYRGDTVALQLKAIALMRTRRLAEARRVIADGLRRFPASAALKVNLGWCDLLEHDLDTARDRFAPLAAAAPGDPTSRTGLAAIAFERHELAGAREGFAEVVRLSAIDPGARANLALALAAEGRDGEAEAQCRSVLSADPDHVQALLCLSGIAQRRGESDRARTLAHRALSCDGHDLSCLVAAAALDSSRGAHESARELLGRALATDPLCTAAHLELGLLEEKQGNLIQARLRLRRAIETDPLEAGGYRALAAIEERAGNLPAAEAILREGLQQVGDADPSLLGDLGHVLRLLGEQVGGEGRYGEAAVRLARACGLDSANGRARFDLGVVQFRQGDLPGAKATFEGLLALRPGDPSATWMLSHLHVAGAEARHTRAWSLALALAAVIESIVAWSALLLGDISDATLAGLLSLFVGLLLVAALLPKLDKVKLGGLEAELTSVVYRDDTATAPGPSAQAPMTISASAGSSIWFWQ